MKFTVIPPLNNNLNPLVREYFSITAGNTIENDRLVLPTGWHYLIFHLKGKAIYSCNGEEIVGKQKTLLCHVQTNAYKMKVSPNFEALVVAMAPNGLYQFFGNTFTNNGFFFSESEDFLDTEDLNLLGAQLGETTDLRRRLELVQLHLQQQLSKNGSNDIVERFMAYMGDFRKEITTRKVASELGTNTRTLELKFCAITGITPGKYIKLRRFNRLVCDVVSKKYSMHDLVARHNYSDYSHMNRDFKKYVGFSITELSRATHPENTPMGIMV